MWNSAFLQKSLILHQVSNKWALQKMFTCFWNNFINQSSVTCVLLSVMWCNMSKGRLIYLGILNHCKCGHISIYFVLSTSYKSIIKPSCINTTFCWENSAAEHKDFCLATKKIRVASTSVYFSDFPKFVQ